MLTSGTSSIWTESYAAARRSLPRSVFASLLSTENEKGGEGKKKRKKSQHRQRGLLRGCGWTGGLLTHCRLLRRRSIPSWSAVLAGLLCQILGVGSRLCRTHLLSPHLGIRDISLG